MCLNYKKPLIALLFEVFLVSDQYRDSVKSFKADLPILASLNLPNTNVMAAKDLGKNYRKARPLLVHHL